MPKSTRLAFIEPAQPVLVDVPPKGEGWIHEIKQDGYRTELVIQAGRVTAYSRSGLDWTDRYPAVVEAAGLLPASSAVLDGEMIVPDANGRSDFHALIQSIKRAPERLAFVAFDLLWLNGRDLRQEPLTTRRAELETLLSQADDTRLIFSRAFDGPGDDVFAAAQQLGLEGIVSKRSNGAYRSGAKAGWFKTKCMMFSTLDVIGVSKTPSGAPVALIADGDRYAGQAFIALPDKLRDAFWRFVEIHQGERPSLKDLGRQKGATWLALRMPAKVKHLAGEPEKLRHATVSEITLPRVTAATPAKKVAARGTPHPRLQPR